jgi:hypothetical protein
LSFRYSIAAFLVFSMGRSSLHRSIPIFASGTLKQKYSRIEVL